MGDRDRGRRVDGFLPDTRWQLYRSALELLLGDHDHRRRTGKPEGVHLRVEEQARIFQRIAVWLVRDGQSELTRAQALRHLRSALPGMKRVSAQGPPEQILTYLLNRSGLLRAPGDDTYQFIHRTFQDYLAAKELIEDEHLGELRSHANEEHWQDVILLAAGHCGRRDPAVLVSGLLDAGERHEEGSIERMRLWVRAALCAQHAAYLDEAVSERVRHSTAALFPPTDDKQVRALVRLGSAALDFLSEPGRLDREDPSVGNVAELIVRVGGALGVPHARAWLRSYPGLSGLFGSAWPFFPPEEYAADVLAHCDASATALVVGDRKRLRALRHIPAVKVLVLTSDLPEEEIGAALKGRRIDVLGIDTNALLVRLSHLDALADTVSMLNISACPGVRDLTPLAGLRRLHSLSLDAQAMCPAELAALARLDRLIVLELNNLMVGRVSEIAAHPGIESLKVTSDRPLVLDGLDAWTSLRNLEISEAAAFDDALTALREHPRITRLGFTAFPWAHRPDRRPAPPPSSTWPCRPLTTARTWGCCGSPSPGSRTSPWTPRHGAYWTSPSCTPGRTSAWR